MTNKSLWPCGHEKTPQNTRKIGSDRVYCRECRRQVDARHRAKLKLLASTALSAA